jgi:hypothetical protein
MFNPTLVVIDAFVERLKANYRRIYGGLHPDYPEVLEFVGRWRSRTSRTATRRTTI